MENILRYRKVRQTACGGNGLNSCISLSVEISRNIQATLDVLVGADGLRRWAFRGAQKKTRMNVNGVVGALWGPHSPKWGFPKLGVPS